MTGYEKPLLPVLLLALALSGCGASEDAGGAGGVTAGEAKALNEAAAMLDQRGRDVRAALAGNGSEEVQ